MARVDVRTYEKLSVEVYENKVELGRAAAALAADRIRSVLSQKETANLLFSTGASQFEFVAALKEFDLEWDRIEAFHLDEYLGIDANHPASFRLWLTERIERPYGPRKFHYIHGDTGDGEAECRRYEELLARNPIDLGFIGIGENGHIAFNDPPVADFNDERGVKIVELDHECRMQQVGEGWFPTVDDVPKYAITLTVPTIMKSKEIISVVPDQRKAQAVKDALTGPLAESCPASILRTHPNATLFLDLSSASLL